MRRDRQLMIKRILRGCILARNCLPLDSAKTYLRVFSSSMQRFKHQLKRYLLYNWPSNRSSLILMRPQYNWSDFFCSCRSRGRGFGISHQPFLPSPTRWMITFRSYCIKIASMGYLLRLVLDVRWLTLPTRSRSATFLLVFRLECFWTGFKGTPCWLFRRFNGVSARIRLLELRLLLNLVHGFRYTCTSVRLLCSRDIRAHAS